MTIVDPITKQDAPSERQLEQKAITRQEQARAIKITGQASLEFAADELRAIVSLRKEIVDHHAPLKQTTHAAWQAAIAAEKKILEPVAEAERIIKTEIGRYSTEQERIRREEERRLREEDERRRREREAEQRRQQEEADRLHAEEIERQIEQAEARGAAPEHITELAQTPAPFVAPVEPVFMPAPVAPARVAPVSGISMRDNWSAEVISVRQLAAAVGAGTQPEELLIGLDRRDGKVSSPALNKLASALKSALSIAGVRPVNNPVVNARAR